MEKKTSFRSAIRAWAERVGTLDATAILVHHGIPASTVSKLLTGNYEPKQALLINAIKEAMKEVS